MSLKSNSWIWTVAALAIAAAVIRMPLLSSNLFIDEVWTLHLLTLVQNAAEIVVLLRHDNNHLLNSLYLYFIRGTDSWPAYRIPSFLAGVGTVILLAIAGNRYRRSIGIATAGAAACSCLLIDLSTQARGYSLAMFFAITAFLLLCRYMEADSKRARVGFQAVVALGFLSHLTFFLVYTGFVVWSAVCLRRKRDWVARVANLHTPILCFLFALCLGSVIGMQFGGGGYSSPLLTIAELFHWTLGVPRKWYFLTAAILAGCSRECWRLCKEGRSEWAFFVGILLMSTIMTCATSRLTPRYFAVCLPFILILIGRALVRLPRLLVFPLVIAFLATQLAHLADFYRYGRGQFDAAAAHISEIGGTVGGDTHVRASNFRIKRMLWYYGPAVRFIDHAHWTSDAPDWAIVHSLDEVPPTPSPVYIGSNAVRYDLERIYRAGGTTPMHWFLYRKRK